MEFVFDLYVKGVLQAGGVVVTIQEDDPVFACMDMVKQASLKALQLPGVIVNPACVLRLDMRDKIKNGFGYKFKKFFVMTAENEEQAVQQLWDAGHLRIINAEGLLQACSRAAKAAGSHTVLIFNEERTAAARGNVLPDKDHQKRIADIIKTSANDLQKLCHAAASNAGWWGGNGKPDPRDNPMCFSQKLMLVVSELAEAMEGDRKGLKDDHLPQRDMREVELADALIRIFDMAGAFGMDIGGAMAEKMAYNAQRADHKPAAREAEGGKKY